jgi:MYXO-CTERM domain-containing protein
VAPIAVVALVALGGLWLSRSRRESRKYEGLRTLR